MSILLLLIINSSSYFSFADDVSTIACDPLEALSLSVEISESRSQIQIFLKNSANYVKEKIKSQDLDAIAVACGLIDQVTEEFTKPCFDDKNTVINLTAVQKDCENYLSHEDPH